MATRPNRRPRTKHAGTIPEYLTIVGKCWRDWFSEDDRLTPWFRGHADASWTLQPGRYRPDCIKTNESDYRHEFRLRAFPHLADATYQPRSDWDWYFLMQHYGVPTRLLDWTESALVGLYFAVASTQPPAPGVVWMLDPYVLNQRLAKVTSLIAYDTSPARRYLGRVWARSKLPRPPLAVEPAHNSRRLAAQSGKFTVHGSSAQPLEDYPSIRSALLRIVIPQEKKRSLERELAIAGITEGVVFPDLAGLGRSIRRAWTREPAVR